MECYFFWSIAARIQQLQVDSLMVMQLSVIIKKINIPFPVLDNHMTRHLNRKWLKSDRNKKIGSELGVWGYIVIMTHWFETFNEFFFGQFP